MSEEVKKEVPPAAPAAEGAAPAEGEAVAKAKKSGRSIPAGIAFIRSTFNNTQVSIADARGGVISWSSAGKAGFKGSRKSTAFAATMVAQDAARVAVAKGMHECEVRMQGAGAGRESAVRAIQAAGIRVTQITDTTPVPHNGCRPRKRRRGTIMRTRRIKMLFRHKTLRGLWRGRQGEDERPKTKDRRRCRQHPPRGFWRISITNRHPPLRGAYLAPVLCLVSLPRSAMPALRALWRTPSPAARIRLAHAGEGRAVLQNRRPVRAARRCTKPFPPIVRTGSCGRRFHRNRPTSPP